MAHLVVFLKDGVFDGVCEDWVSAHGVETYLVGVSNDVEVVSVLGPSLDSCWELLDTLDFMVEYE